MKLEVIAANIEDIKLINESKADRIEFCSNLEVGGLTPSYEDVIKAVEISEVPINVMLRPTDRDFVYTDDEYNLMIEDAKFLASTNIAGIVVGIITNDGEVDVNRMKMIIEIAKAKGKTITFHKAFEQLNDPIKSLKILADLSVDTILTSGTPNINESLDLLQELTNQERCKILAGGGVGFDNVELIMPHVNEVHVGTAVREQKSWSVPVSIEKINKMKKIID